MAMRLRRGLEADRAGITPLSGELIFVTDTGLVYVGDGITAGGVLIGSGSSIYTSSGSLPSDITVSMTSHQLNFTGTNDTYFAIHPNDKFIALYTNDGDDGIQINPGANELWLRCRGNYVIYNDGTNTLINPYSGNVGVGNNTPIQLLQVGSQTPADGSLPGIYSTVGGNTYVCADNGTINTFMGSDGSGTGIIGTLTNHALVLRTHNLEALRIGANQAIQFNSAYTFPTTDGTTGQSLRTNGSGAIVWGSPTVNSYNMDGGDTATIAFNTDDLAIVNFNGSMGQYTVNIGSGFTPGRKIEVVLAGSDATNMGVTFASAIKWITAAPSVFSSSSEILVSLTAKTSSLVIGKVVGSYTP